MKIYAKPIIGSYSIVGILNMLIFQWLCFRLIGIINIPDYTDEELATLPTGRKSDDGRYFTGFGLLGFMLPLTGWWNKYVYIVKCGMVVLKFPKFRRGVCGQSKEFKYGN